MLCSLCSVISALFSVLCDMGSGSWPISPLSVLVLCFVLCALLSGLWLCVLCSLLCALCSGTVLCAFFSDSVLRDLCCMPYYLFSGF